MCAGFLQAPRCCWLTIEQCNLRESQLCGPLRVDCVHWKVVERLKTIYFLVAEATTFFCSFFHFLFKYFKAPIFHLRFENTSYTSDAREVVQDASNLMSLFCFFDTLPSSCVLSFNHHICEMDHMIMYSFIPCFGRSSVRLSSSFRRRCAVGREPATISAVVLRFLFPDPRPRQLPSWLAGAAE